MKGWSSHLGGDGWDDEPAWLYEITWEWEQLPGPHHPGDPERRRRAVHIPVYEASRGDDVHGIGVAHVVPTPPPSDSQEDQSPTRPAPFEQMRPIPQKGRPQFRHAPPPVQDMPAPFYGPAQPTLRDIRPRSNGTPVQPREGRPADRPTPYLPGPDHQPRAAVPPRDATWTPGPFRWDSPQADPATTLAGPETTVADPTAEAETVHHDDVHGLGWRLKSLGLGAVTTGPESAAKAYVGDDEHQARAQRSTDAATPASGTAPPSRTGSRRPRQPAEAAGAGAGSRRGRGAASGGRARKESRDDPRAGSSIPSRCSPRTPGGFPGDAARGDRRAGPAPAPSGIG